MNHQVTVETTLRILCQGERAFGPGLAQLLEGIERLGSLRRSAAEMGMSYNKAWNIVKKSEESWGFPLMERKIGGAQGGGARLTPQGKEIQMRYHAFEQEAKQVLQALTDKHFQEV